MANQIQSSSSSILSQSQYEEILKKEEETPPNSCAASSSTIDRISFWHTLPQEIQGRVLEYLDNRGFANMRATCRSWHQAADDDINTIVKQHPLLLHIYKHSSMVQSASDMTQKLKAIAKIVAYATIDTTSAIEQISNRLEWGDSRTSSFMLLQIEQRSPLIETRYQSHPLAAFTASRDMNTLTTLTDKAGFGGIFLASLLLKDKNLSHSFCIKNLPQNTIDRAAKIFLTNKNESAFQEILHLTSLYDRNGNNSPEARNEAGRFVNFLTISSEQKLFRTIELLLKRDTLYDPNKLLFVLARKNVGNAITSLLNIKGDKIDTNFTPDNESAWTPGDLTSTARSVPLSLHTAFMWAVSLNHQEAISAILESNLQINYLILKHVRDLVHNHDFNQRFTAQFNMLDGLFDALNQNPNRQALVEQLDKEIHSRFPDLDHENGTLPDFLPEPVLPEPEELLLPAEVPPPERRCNWKWAATQVATYATGIFVALALHYAGVIDR